MTIETVWRWLTILLLALIFKAAYSTASTEHLQWLLWPLAELLNVTGLFDFVPVAGGEWLDAGRGLIIVKACAGGNFLMASWLGWLWRWRTHPFNPARVLRALAAAWLIALLANAARIVLIGYGQADLARLTGLSEADCHRLIGVGVYFGALLLQLRGTGSLWAAPAIYLGITLLVPLTHLWLTGQGGLDRGHALWTATLPAAALLAYALAGRGRQALTRRLKWPINSRYSEKCARTGLKSGI